MNAIAAAAAASSDPGTTPSPHQHQLPLQSPSYYPPQAQQGYSAASTSLPVLAPRDSSEEAAGGSGGAAKKRKNSGLVPTAADDAAESQKAKKVRTALSTLHRVLVVTADLERRGDHAAQDSARVRRLPPQEDPVRSAVVSESVIRSVSLMLHAVLQVQPTAGPGGEAVHVLPEAPPRLHLGTLLFPPRSASLTVSLTNTSTSTVPAHIRDAVQEATGEGRGGQGERICCRRGCRAPYGCDVGDTRATGSCGRFAAVRIADARCEWQCAGRAERDQRWRWRAQCAQAADLPHRRQQPLGVVARLAAAEWAPQGAADCRLHEHLAPDALDVDLSHRAHDPRRLQVLAEAQRQRDWRRLHPRHLGGRWRSDTGRGAGRDPGHRALGRREAHQVRLPCRLVLAHLCPLANSRLARLAATFSQRTRTTSRSSPRPTSSAPSAPSHSSSTPSAPSLPCHTTSRRRSCAPSRRRSALTCATKTCSTTRPSPTSRPSSSTLSRWSSRRARPRARRGTCSGSRSAWRRTWACTASSAASARNRARRTTPS